MLMFVSGECAGGFPWHSSLHAFAFFDSVCVTVPYTPGGSLFNRYSPPPLEVCVVPVLPLVSMQLISLIPCFVVSFSAGVP